MMPCVLFDVWSRNGKMSDDLEFLQDSKIHKEYCALDMWQLTSFRQVFRQVLDRFWRFLSESV